MTDAGEAPTRVLLVDDHPLVRAAVRLAITSPDFEVIGEAGSGEAALALSEELRPDLVLLDLDLPDMSGLDVLRELERTSPATQVVILTVSGAQHDLVEAVRHGAIGYLTKDVTADALLRSVQAARDGEMPIPRRMAAAAISQLALAPAAVGSAGIGSLTDREVDVLGLIAGGRTDREAASTLAISTRTVESHVSTILRKLGVRNRADAARIYRTSAGSAAEPGGRHEAR